MGRKLTFEMIADDRFDGADYAEIGRERFEKVKKTFDNMDGIKLEFGIARRVDFETCHQTRTRFFITKQTRKLTWGDIYGIINKIKPCYYEFMKA